MDEEEIKLQVQEILESIPDDFDILEAQINPAVINEYIDTSEKMDFEEYNEQDLAEEGEKLFSSDVPDETKKKILILLAHSGTVKSYRIIEKYSKNIDAGLKDWCLLSLRESRMLLENYLSDEAQGFVLTGLGGRDGKLRYLFIMTSATGGSFTVFQKDMIRNEFLIVTERFNSELETIDFDKNYAMLKILVPLDVAIGNVIEKGINECNKYDDIVFRHYYATNEKITAKDEMEEILKEIIGAY